MVAEIRTHAENNIIDENIMDCPFCELVNDEASNRIIVNNKTAVAVRDGFPISAGHALIIPRRHVASFFDITNDERIALCELVAATKKFLDKGFNPSAYNVGINDGVAAGQTVPHLHIHLVPRYIGDVEDPRGGIRWVLPDKARYWD